MLSKHKDFQTINLYNEVKLFCVKCMQRRLGYLHNQKYHLVFLIQKDKYITEAQLKKKKKEYWLLWNANFSCWYILTPQSS